MFIYVDPKTFLILFSLVCSKHNSIMLENPDILAYLILGKKQQLLTKLREINSKVLRAVKKLPNHRKKQKLLLQQHGKRLSKVSIYHHD